MRLLAFLGALSCLAASPLRAEPGRTAASFLQRSLGARPAGMGGAFAAVAGSVDSMQYNPAALATLPAPVLSSTYLKAFGGGNFGFLAYAHPTRLGTLAAGAVYYTAGSIDLNLSDGTRGRVTAEENTAWTFSYAARPLPGLHLGATYRHLRQELAETARALTSQGDAGLLWQTPLRGLSAGGAYQYWGPDIKFEEAGDPPPKTWRLGLAYHAVDIDASKLDPGVELQKFDLVLAADLVKVLQEKASPRLGMEMGLEPFYLNRVAIRFGWVFERDTESFTFGIGFRQGNLLFDYAFSPAGDLGNLQHLTLSYLFGAPPPAPSRP